MTLLSSRIPHQLLLALLELFGFIDSFNGTEAQALSTSREAAGVGLLLVLFAHSLAPLRRFSSAVRICRLSLVWVPPLDRGMMWSTWWGMPVSLEMRRHSA